MARAMVVDRTETVLDEHERIVEEYRERLAKKAELPEWRWPPVRIGPTWQTTPNGYWLLPERTIGWDVLGRCGTHLQHRKDEPWRFTLEQARFILWWYALEPDGAFLYRDGVLQRLKGWGKDPLGACLCYTELLGPCRFLEWYHGDDAVATDNPEAWVQTAAVSIEQTKNTMRLFPGLITEAAKAEAAMQIGKEQIYALSGTRFLQAHTSSPRSMEGARSTFVLLNETHQWIKSNEGHEMWAVIRRNLAKAPDGGARSLSITNAYEPNEDSVAERRRTTWEKVQAMGVASRGPTEEEGEEILTTGVMYDSLEAAPEAPLAADVAAEVVESIRGDSTWAGKGAVAEILDLDNPPSHSRRWWYNQITAAEDAWLTPQQWDAGEDTSLVLAKGEQIVAFFDGSKSDDATSLKAVRVSDGASFPMGLWQRPPETSALAVGWTVPRDEVDGQVRWMFANFDVVGFFGDPGAGEDESGQRFWDAIMDGWSRDFGGDGPDARQLCLWAVTTGPDRHAVTWDMRSTARRRLFTEAAERTLADIIGDPEDPETPGPLRHGGRVEGMTEGQWRRLRSLERQHALNARRRPNDWGVSIGKESRMSAKKIDDAVTLIGARMVWRLYEALPEDKKRQGPRWHGIYIPPEDNA